MRTAVRTYGERIGSLINELLEAEASQIEVAAERLAASIADGGIIHVFGSGHSSLLAQEVFHRAGGLVPVNAMLDVNLTIFGTARATAVERLEGYAASILATYDLRPGEVVIVISVSGINPVPVEVAQLAKERGATVIGVVSASAYAEAPTRHSAGLRLQEVCDLVLDLHVPLGDAIQPVGDEGTMVGASSTILGSVLLNAVFVAAAEQLAERGEQVPSFRSQNIPGGDAHNETLLDRYADRIPLMRR